MKCAQPATRGFSLVEVTLALGVMAFCAVAIFGLLPVGLNSNQAAIQQTLAVNIATAIHSDLRATAGDKTFSPQFNLKLDGDSPALYFKEDGTVVAKADARFQARVFLTPGTNHAASTGRIRISWPAPQDDMTKVSGLIETFIALDRNPSP